MGYLRSQLLIPAISAILIASSIGISAQGGDVTDPPSETTTPSNETIQGRAFNWHICQREPVRLSRQGAFSSRYFDGSRHYDNDVRCRWRLKAKSGSVLRIEVLHFDLEYSLNCLKDRFSVVVGSSRRAAPILTRCGKYAPFTIFTCNEIAHVTFMSDDRYGAVGFTAIFKSVSPAENRCDGGSQTGDQPTPAPTPAPPSGGSPGNQCPATPVTLGGTGGTLESPSFPLYPNNADCTWIITVDQGKVILVHFLEFIVQLSRNCRKDSLTLYDGPTDQSTQLAKYCGQTFSDVTSSKNQMFIRFRSDSARVRRGFRAEYSAKNAPGSGGPPSGGQPGTTCYAPVKKPRDDFIVGGIPANAHSFPWMVSVFLDYYGSGKAHYCGGTIVDQKTIVTAAHCIIYRKEGTWVNQTLNPQKYEVHVGVDRLYDGSNTNEKVHRVTKITVHEGFDPPTFFRDVALLTVDPPIQYGPTALPLCFGDVVEPGKSCIIAGWGDTQGTGDPTLGRVLYQASVPIIQDDVCKSWQYGDLVKKGMFCAGYEGGQIDSCQGDSGGPLFCKGDDGQFRLIGITSWGIGCAQVQRPGVYTSVPDYKSWIQQHMA